MKKWILIMISGILLLGAALPASAAKPTNVVYEGGASGIVFPDGQNLFRGFVGAMPGDTLAQTIHISNTSGSTVQLRMRAEAAEDARDLPAQLILRLTYTDTDGNVSALYDGNASEWKKDSEGNPNISLGSYENGKRGTLEAEVLIPTALGNEYQEKLGKIKWIFQAEETGDSSGKRHSHSSVSAAASPQTGDTSNGMACIALMTATLAAGSGIRHLGKNSRKH